MRGLVPLGELARLLLPLWIEVQEEKIKFSDGCMVRKKVRSDKHRRVCKCVVR